MPRAMRIRLAVVTVLFGAFAVACSSSSSSGQPPRATEVLLGTPAPADTLSVGFVVQSDSTVLNGRLFGDEHPVVVILSHMRPNDQTAWYPFAQELADAGYAALTFDFRGYGASQESKDDSKLDDDLSAALRYMRESGKEQVFLVGASMGGTASLIVAEREAIEGVISISAPSEFQGHDARNAIAEIDAPLLLLASEDDTAARISLVELEEAAGGAAESETYAGDEHGTDIFTGTNAAAVRARILRFLEDHSSN